MNPDEAQRKLEEGMALEQAGQLDGAMRCYDEAIGLQPDLARAHFNRGTILLDRGEAKNALLAYAKTVELKPDSATAYFNIGHAQLDLGENEAATVAYERAIDLKPGFSDAHNALGVALACQNKSAEAALQFRRAIELRPADHMAHSNLGDALRTLGRPLEAIDSYRTALQINPQFSRAHSNLLFALNFVSESHQHQMLAEAQRYGETVSRLAGKSLGFQNSRAPGRRLRIGFVSPDFRAHPVSYFLEPVLAALYETAATQLETFAYFSFPHEDPVSKRIQRYCHVWRQVAAFSDKHLSQQIRDDHIDILIDLSGHTALNRLPVFAWKPAPIQVSWLGYFATTGVGAIDYLIADPWTLPEGEETQFSEKIWRLPETRLCFAAPVEDLVVNLLPALDTGYLTFGSFHYLAKLNDVVVSVWARLLTAVPNSRLFLMAPQLGEVSECQRIIDRFANCGIAPARLIVQSRLPRNEYLACYQNVDIVLDTFPYNGGTTTAEALWMGVPVLTMIGTAFASRQGMGLMLNAGLHEWIASDPDDYVARALAHASDLPALASLRAGLRKQVLASPIYDAPRFARHFEQALRGMWHKWCQEP